MGYLILWADIPAHHRSHLPASYASSLGGGCAAACYSGGGLPYRCAFPAVRGGLCRIHLQQEDGACYQRTLASREKARRTRARHRQLRRAMCAEADQRWR